MNNKEDENTPADIRLEGEPDSSSLRSPVLLLPSETSPVPEDFVQPSPCADQYYVSAEDPLPDLVSQHGGGGTSPFSPTFDSTSSFDAVDVSHTDVQQCFDSGTNKMLKTKETSNPWQKKWVQNANIGKKYESYPKLDESFPCNKLQPDVGVENRVQSCSRKRGRPRKHPIALKPETPLSNELQCETVFLSDRECIDFDENDYDSTPHSMKGGNFYRKGSDANSQKSSLGTACTAFCDSSFKTTAQISTNVKVQIENLSAKKSVHDTFNQKHDEKQISSEGDKEAETIQKRKRGRPPKTAASVQKHDMKQLSYEVDKERETVQKRKRGRPSISNTLIQKHYIHLTSNELDKEAEIVQKQKKGRLPNSGTSFQKHDRKQTINDKETQIVRKNKRVQSFLVYASVQKHGLKQISNEVDKERETVLITKRKRPPDTLILERYVQQTNHEVDKEAETLQKQKRSRLPFSNKSTQKYIQQINNEVKKEAETVQKKKRGRPPKKSIVNSGDNPVSHSQDSEEFSEVRSTKRHPSLKLLKCDLICIKKIAGKGKRTIKKSKWSDDFVTVYNSTRTSAAPSNPMRPGFDRKQHRSRDHHCREKMSFHSDVSGNSIFSSVNVDSSHSNTSVVNESFQPGQILNKSFQLSATLNESSQANATLSESSQTNATLSHSASLGAAVNEPVLIKRKRGRPKKNAMPQPLVTSTPLCQSGRSIAENQKCTLHQDSVSDEEQNTSEQKGDNIDSKNKIERCLRCDEKMDTLYHYKQHLMTRHAAWYTSKTPAGEENGIALRAIIKHLGKVCCPKCQKPFKHHQYFQYHLLWCGREGEKQTCEICGRTVKAMWFHMHERSHQQKEMKIEKEFDSDNQANVAEGKSDKRVRRKAAKLALESLKDMTETELENENGEKRKTKRVEHEEWNAGSCEESDNDFHELDSDQEQKRRPFTVIPPFSPSLKEAVFIEDDMMIETVCIEDEMRIEIICVEEDDLNIETLCIEDNMPLATLTAENSAEHKPLATLTAENSAEHKPLATLTAENSAEYTTSRDAVIRGDDAGVFAIIVEKDQIEDGRKKVNAYVPRVTRLSVKNGNNGMVCATRVERHDVQHDGLLAHIIETDIAEDDIPCPLIMEAENAEDNNSCPVTEMDSAEDEMSYPRTEMVREEVDINCPRSGTEGVVGIPCATVIKTDSVENETLYAQGTDRDTTTTNNPCYCADRLAVPSSSRSSTDNENPSNLNTDNNELLNKWLISQLEIIELKKELLEMEKIKMGLKIQKLKRELTAMSGVGESWSQDK